MNTDDRNNDKSNKSESTTPTTKRKRSLPADFQPGPFDVVCGRGKVCGFSSIVFVLSSYRFRARSQNVTNEMHVLSCWQYYYYHITCTGYRHAGNLRLRNTIVASLVDDYARAEGNKDDKSRIVARVIAAVQERGAGFVKLDVIDGSWYEVSHDQAREKVSQVFRNLLHDRYKSSAAARRNQRRLEQEQLERSSSSSPPLPEPMPRDHGEADGSRAVTMMLQGTDDNSHWSMSSIFVATGGTVIESSSSTSSAVISSSLSLLRPVVAGDHRQRRQVSATRQVVVDGNGGSAGAGGGVSSSSSSASSSRHEQEQQQRQRHDKAEVAVAAAADRFNDDIDINKANYEAVTPPLQPYHQHHHHHSEPEAKTNQDGGKASAAIRTLPSGNDPTITTSTTHSSLQHQHLPPVPPAPNEDENNEASSIVADLNDTLPRLSLILTFDDDFLLFTAAEEWMNRRHRHVVVIKLVLIQSEPINNSMSYH
jgi:hypothetical protein